VFFKLNTHLIRPLPQEDEKFNLFMDIEQNINVVYVHPWLQEHSFINQLKNVKGVILVAYGMGNFPINQTGMLDAIGKATENGIPCVVVTQCRKGHVASEYEAGNLLVQRGAILAADMSIESAVAKLSYLLGKKYSFD